MADVQTPPTPLTTIDVQKFAGANLGAKIIAALASLPPTSGAASNQPSVIDCGRFSGDATISATINVTTPVEIILPATDIAVTASPGFYFQDGPSFADRTGAADQSILRGSGRRTRLIAVAPVTPIIRISAYDVSVRDMALFFSTGDATSVCIDCNPDVLKSNNVLRPRLRNLLLYQQQLEPTTRFGIGIRMLHVYVGSVSEIYATGFTYGMQFRASTTATSGNNAVPVYGGCRFYKNTEGIRVEGTSPTRAGCGDMQILGCTIEGNDTYGMHILVASGVTLMGNHWEQVGAAVTNIQWDFIAGDTFTRTLDGFNESFGGGGPASFICDAANMRAYFHGGGLNGSVEMNDSSSFTQFIGTRQFAAAVNVGDVRTIFGLTDGVDNYTKIVGPSTKNMDFTGWSGVRVVGASGNLFDASITLETVGIGQSAPSLSKLGVTRTVTDEGLNAQSHNAMAVTLNCSTAVGPVTNTRQAILNTLSITGASAYATIIGYGLTLTHGGAGVVTTLRGHNAILTSNGGGTVTTAVGYFTSWNQTGGSTPTLVGYQVATPVLAGGATVTNYYAIFISDIGATGSSDNYAIRSFGGNIGLTINASRSETINFISTTDPNLFWADSVTNNVSVGAVVDASSRFRSFFRSTALVGTLNGIVSQMEFNPSAGSATSGYGINVTGDVQSGNVQTITGLVGGANISGEHRGTANLTNLRGAAIRTLMNAVGTVTTNEVISATASVTSTGGATNVRVLNAQISNTGGATLVNGTVIRVVAPANTGTITTYIGIDIEDPVAGIFVTKIALRTRGGNVIFNDDNGSYDWRVEGVADGGVLAVQGSTDRAGVGTLTPAAKFEVAGLNLVAATSPIHVKFTGPSYTDLANAEVNDVYFDLSRTINFVGGGGAVATARSFLIDAPTYTADVAQTFTDAATVSIVGAPIFTSNASATRKYGLWVSGTHSITSPSLRCDSVMVLYDTGQSITGGAMWGFRVVPAATQFALSMNTAANGDFSTLTNFLIIDGSNANWSLVGKNWKLTQDAITGGTNNGFIYSAGAHLDLANAEFNDVQINVDVTANFTGGGGAIATQRCVRITARTFTADAAQTITTAATLAITAAPAAGDANITITQSYALWVQAGRSLFDGGILIGGEPAGVAGKVGYTNTVDNSANNIGIGTILFKGATSRNSSGFLKILDGTTARYIPYFDAISG